MNCPNCTKPVDAGTPVCPHCGWLLGVDTGAAADDPDATVAIPDGVFTDLRKKGPPPPGGKYGGLAPPGQPRATAAAAATAPAPSAKFDLPPQATMRALDPEALATRTPRYYRKSNPGPAIAIGAAAGVAGLVLLVFMVRAFSGGTVGTPSIDPIDQPKPRTEVQKLYFIDKHMAEGGRLTLYALTPHQLSSGEQQKVVNDLGKALAKYKSARGFFDSRADYDTWKGSGASVRLVLRLQSSPHDYDGYNNVGFQVN